MSGYFALAIGVLGQVHFAKTPTMAQPNSPD